MQNIKFFSEFVVFEANKYFISEANNFLCVDCYCVEKKEILPFCRVEYKSVWVIGIVVKASVSNQDCLS